MHFSSALLVLASAFIVGSSALNMFVFHPLSIPHSSPFLSSPLLPKNILPSHFPLWSRAWYFFAILESDIHRPREALPVPAGCNGGSFQATTSAAAAAECAASGCQSCMTPFANGGYYYAICECNVSGSRLIKKRERVDLRLNGNSKQKVRSGCRVSLGERMRCWWFAWNIGFYDEWRLESKRQGTG